MSSIDVKAIRKKLGMTQESFGDAIGVSKRTIVKYENGHPVPESKVKLIRLISEQNATSDEVNQDSSLVLIPVTDPYKMDFFENNNANSFMKLENGQYLMTMPLAEFSIQAGLLDHYQDIEYIKEMAKHSIIVDEPARGRYMAFRVKGDSMDNGTSDAILHDSVVSTRELQRQHWTNKIRYNDFPYWVIYTTESRYPLLKQIIDHDVERGIIKCHSLNDGPEFPDFDLSLDTVQALFYVIDVSRKLSKKGIY